MKRLLLYFSCAVLAFTAAQAQLLWRVTAPGNPRHSYIFGTYHLADSSFIGSVQGLAQALDSCDAVWGEVQRDSLTSPEALAKMTTAMQAPPDSTLNKLLSPDSYKIVADVFNGYFSDFALTLDKVNSLKPAAISAQIEALQALKYFPAQDPSAMLDLALQTKAMLKGKPTFGLEGIDDQTQVLFGRDIVKQAQDLLEQCKNDGKYQQLNRQLLEAYRSGDLDKIGSLMFDPEAGGDDEQYRADLIDNRNIRWMTKLKPAIAAGSVLVCVGAGHLPGDKGILNLLRQAGCTVTPVQNKN